MDLPIRAWTATLAALGFVKRKTLSKAKARKPRQLQLESLEYRWLMSTVALFSDGYGGTGGPCIPCQTASQINTNPNAYGGNVSAAAVSASGVQYGTGDIFLAGGPGASGNIGTTYGQSLIWSNEAQPSATINGGAGIFGHGMSNPELPYLGQVLLSGIPEFDPSASVSTITVYDSSITDIFWSETVYADGEEYGTFHAENFTQDTLAFDSTNDLYVFTDTSGDTLTFHAFGPSTPTAEQGQLAEVIDAGGNTASASYNTSGQLSEMDLTPAGASAPVQKYEYSYYGSDSLNDGMVSTVEVFGEASSTVPVQQIAYTYYDGTYGFNSEADTYSGPEQYGNLNDLMTSVIEDASGHAIDTTYYRYYTPTNDTNGYEHGLEYMFSNASYTRLETQFSGDATSQLNADVQPFADEYLQYNYLNQVSQLTTQGAGCSVCGDGLGEYQYSYTPNIHETSPDYNLWSIETVETLPDGSSTNTVYSNFAGETLLADHYDAPSGKDSFTYYTYDPAGRLSDTYNPSAVASASPESSGDHGLYVVLNTTGLIDENVYYTSTTTGSDVTIATSGSPSTVSTSTATAGGVTGLLEAQFLIDGASTGATVTDGTLDGSFGTTVALQNYTQYFEATQDLSVG